MSISDLKLDYELKVGGYNFLPNTSFKTVLNRIVANLGGGSGVSDGTYDEIIVSNSGMDWVVVPNTLTNAQLQTGVGGIYKGSGSLSGNTTVTMALNDLKFLGTGTELHLTTDATFPQMFQYTYSGGGDIEASNTLTATSSPTNRRFTYTLTGSVESLMTATPGAPTYKTYVSSSGVYRSILLDTTGLKLINNSGGAGYYLPATLPSTTNLTKSMMLWTGTGSAATPSFTTGSPRPYKVYVAIISQNGVAAPTATILENDLGGTPTWTYDGPGSYVCTLTGAFTINKTVAIITNNHTIGVARDIAAYVAGTDTVGVITYNAGASADDQLIKNYFEIRVYP
jgi:hypothetical protein